MPEAPLPIAQRPSPFHGEEHAEFRRLVRRFVEAEILPFSDAWDEAEEFPRDLYRKAGGSRAPRRRLSGILRRRRW
jgi:acyl-CoA dehydrogenase